MATVLFAESPLSCFLPPNTNPPACCCAKLMLWIGAGTIVGTGGTGASLLHSQY